MADVEATKWTQAIVDRTIGVPTTAWGQQPPDATPPTVDLVSPPDGSQIAAGDDVVIDITAPAGLVLIVLSVSFPLDGLRPAEVVYSSSRGVHARYLGTTISSIADGVRVTMRRVGGWPATQLSFDPDVVTATGVLNT